MVSVTIGSGALTVDDGNIAVPDGYLTQEGQGASAYLASAQDISSGSGGWTKIDLDSETFDTDGLFNTTTHKFVPKVTGTYLVTAKVSLSGLSTGEQASVEVYKNGAFHIRGNQIQQGGTGSATPTIIVLATGIIELTASTDDLELYAYHTGPSSANSVTALGGSSPVFTGLDAWLLG